MDGDPAKLGAELGRLQKQYIEKSGEIRDKQIERKNYEDSIKQMGEHKKTIENDAKRIENVRVEMRRLQQREQGLNSFFQRKERSRVSDRISEKRDEIERLEKDFKRNHGVTVDRKVLKLNSLDSQMTDKGNELKKLPDEKSILRQQNELAKTKDEYIRLKELSNTYSKSDQKTIEIAENKHLKNELTQSEYRAAIDLTRATQPQKRSSKGGTDDEAMRACMERRAAFSSIYNARNSAQSQSRARGRSR